MFKDLWQKSIGSNQPSLVLIGLNVLFFILTAAFRAMVSFGWLPNSLSIGLSWLTELPAEWSQFIVRPWTLFSYMFIHHHFFHLLFNMLWLFWMGRIFLDFFSNKLFYRIYLGGGICGGIIFLILFPLIPAFNQVIQNYFLVGASASVSGIVLALAVLLPNYSIQLLLFGRVPLKYLALAFVILDFLSLGGANPGGSLAHLGGGLFGVLLALNQKGSIRLPSFKTSSRSSKKLKVVHSHSKKSFPNKGKAENDREISQEVIDQILDKISKSGYENLSAKEKELLFKASKTDIKEK